MRFRFLAIIVSVVVCLALGQSYCFAHGSETEKDSKIKSWNKVNGVFHKIYAKKRGEIRKTLDPLVIVKGNNLILVKDGKRESFVLNSDRYDLFKIVSHIPLAIHVSLFDDTDCSINTATQKELSDLKKTVLEARKNIKEWKFSKSIEDLQFLIIDESVSFIDKVMKENSVSAKELRKFTRDMAPRTLDNAYEAIKIELGNVDKNLRPFKEKITPEQWKNMYVVILSSHMPRIQERRSQYFCKLLREKDLGHRVIYYEGPPYDEKAALKLVATHILDRSVAIDFFKDPKRMHRDLLSDAAKKYLRKNSLNWAKD